MAKIQIANLQCSHQLTASELKQVVGGHHLLAIFQSDLLRAQALNNPNLSVGAVATAINQSNLPQEQKQAALIFLWSYPDAAIQIVAPI